VSAIEWLRRPQLQGPPALCAFGGWGDAGDASTGALRYLIAHLEGEPIARLDPDQFYEFQARRPQVEFEDGVRSIHWPENQVHALRHQGGDLVAMVGEEPHLRWRTFSDELATALQQLGVGKVVLLGAFLGQVAHTRPVPLVGSAADARVLRGLQIEVSGYEGPTGIVGVLTQRLAELGFEAMSIWAAVPHYLSNQSFPPAVHALVEKAAEVLGIRLDLSELAKAAREFRHTVDAVVADNEELRNYIQRLEQAAELGPGELDRGEIEADDELITEIERFLEER
jgi:proteasome assembly chaperone (PAC2) family protein